MTARALTPRPPRPDMGEGEADGFSPSPLEGEGPGGEGVSNALFNSFVGKVAGDRYGSVRQLIGDVGELQGRVRGGVVAAIRQARVFRVEHGVEQDTERVYRRDR